MNYRPRGLLAAAAAAFMLLLTNCNQYYLQHASVLTNRKMPSITTSVNKPGIFDVEVSGGYTKKGQAEFSQGMHTDYVSEDGEFDYAAEKEAPRNQNPHPSFITAAIKAHRLCG